MSASSLSEFEIEITVHAKGTLEGKLYKHLSPATLNKIQRALPLDGRVNLYEKDFAYILTNVVTGEEKSRKDFKRGDIAFMPAGCMLCFFLQDMRSYKPMNLLGMISSGMELLESCKRGDSLHVQAKDPVR